MSKIHCTRPLGWSGGGCPVQFLRGGRTVITWLDTMLQIKETETGPRILIKTKRIKAHLPKISPRTPELIPGLLSRVRGCVRGVVRPLLWCFACYLDRNHATNKGNRNRNGNMNKNKENKGSLAENFAQNPGTHPGTAFAGSGMRSRSGSAAFGVFYLLLG